ncbi:MAG: hypothetical protein ACE37J_21975 [Pikeienuella sp.]|uniref:hypothetical protein n=1 Tax=Pikeienuella sp. TaxID=2831957 RepID=UPI00391DAC29
MKYAVLAAFAAIPLAMAAPAQAASFTFATFTFDQDDTPDTFGLLGNGATIGGATFSSNLPNSITRSVGFNSVSGNANSGFVGEPGFDPSLSLGRQANAQAGVTQSDGSSCLFACALNLPRSNLGESRRHGLEVTWSGGLVLTNGAGDDFVVFESASSSTADEGYMVRVGTSGGAFSDWRFEAFDAFEAYTVSPGTTGEGAHATGFDLTSFGLGINDTINVIQIANLMPADTLGSGGLVLFDGSGSATGFASGAFDPDPLYIGALSAVIDPNSAAVPLPPAGFLLLGALGALGIFRRRKAG